MEANVITGRPPDALAAQAAAAASLQKPKWWFPFIFGEHGAGSSTFATLQADCQRGVAEGWLCKREGGGIRYGRIFKAADDLQRFSVDVVDMENIAGPHHTHPQGEIDLVMPIAGDALFDGHPAGWMVCPPGSAHSPTVSQGRALVLYLLPEGDIVFTR